MDPLLELLFSTDEFIIKYTIKILIIILDNESKNTAHKTLFQNFCEEDGIERFHEILDSFQIDEKLQFQIQQFIDSHQIKEE